PRRIASDARGTSRAILTRLARRAAGFVAVGLTGTVLAGFTFSTADVAADLILRTALGQLGAAPSPRRTALLLAVAPRADLAARTALAADLGTGRIAARALDAGSQPAAAGARGAAAARARGSGHAFAALAVATQPRR